MAAYDAVLSLEPRIKRHLVNDNYPSYLLAPPDVFGIMAEAREQIESTRQALQILDRDNGLGSWERMRAWRLVGSQLLKQFPLEYAIAHFAVYGVALDLVRFIGRTQVADSDIGRVRDEACGLQLVLESLLSSLQLKQQRRTQILAELDTAEQQIRCFRQMVEKIIKDEGNKSETRAMFFDGLYNMVRDLIREIERHGNKMLDEMEEALRRLNHGSRERVSVVEVQIREAVSEIEDLLDNRLTDQFPVPFPLNLHEVKKYIPPFTQLMGKLKQEYMNELINPLPEEGGDNNDNITLRKSYGKNKSKMVGLYDEVAKIKTYLIKSYYLRTIALFGMGGIGKTTVAEHVFNDPSILERFELRAWVEVGQNYQLKRIKQSILSQVMNRPHNIDEILAGGGGDEVLDEYLHQSLKGRKYLIVLDDVWDDCEFWNGMIERLFPNGKNESRILMTTRRQDTSMGRHQIRFLSKEESWELLCNKVFGEVSLCPPLLKNAGKKIAESCEGLPLTIITVAELLSKVRMTPEKWNELADNPNSLTGEAYDQMAKVLLPSYNYLTQELKVSFLYLGVFPRNYEIALSELFMLWVAEKLLDEDMNLGKFENIINHLHNNSLIIKRQKSSSFGIKTWSLHSSFWHLCRREASKNKFSYVLECFGDSLLEDIKNQRRLCVHKNILFSIKDVHKSMTSISTARSLLCTGPPHQYSVPICYNIKLLRILSVITIRLYEFPMDVLKLSQLKYLALTFYGNLPSSISKLWNLEVLIIRRHLTDVSSKAPSYLPVEIWDMKELKHLQVMGSDLPDPCEGTFLPKLQTLSGVSARSCTKFFFEGTPKLNKLGIRIELMPDGHATETSHCFDHICLLKKLYSLKCVVVNPTFGSHVTPPTLPAVFPSSLAKLSLSGFGYPWEDMRLIASLPNLTILKLRCYAFRGPKLEIKGNGFPKLANLLIEDTDLVSWTVEQGSLARILYILFKSCYKLENMSNDKNNHTFTELVDRYKLENISKR